MTAETDKLYASLPRELQEEIDRRAHALRVHIHNKRGGMEKFSVSGAREVVIKTLEYVSKNEVTR